MVGIPQLHAIYNLSSLLSDKINSDETGATIITGQ